jgi:HAD superfamily hydrolase (TIGR01549 family)
VTPRPLRAVLFDLDDTLVPQAPWLAGCLEAVVARAQELDPGIDIEGFRRALAREVAGGSARGGLIDRALAAVGSALPVGPLVAAFRAYRAPRLVPFPGVEDLLERLAARFSLGIVSDGDPGIQRAKLAASGLADRFAVVVLADELGRSRRKPHPAPYRLALARLGVLPGETVFVGDRPETDLVGAAALGLGTIRVRQGEHAASPDQVPPDGQVEQVAEVEHLLARWAEDRGRPSREGPALVSCAP